MKEKLQQTSSFIAWGLFIILLLILFFDFPPIRTDGRSLWYRSEAYFISSMISVLACLIVFMNGQTLYRYGKSCLNYAYIATWAHIICNIYACRWEIPFVVPSVITALLVVTLFRNERYLSIMGILVILITLVSAFGAAHISLSGNIIEHEHALQAKQNPPIVLIDVKDNYIVTQEFGLEQQKEHCHTQQPILAKGDSIYRTEIPDGLVWIEKK